MPHYARSSLFGCAAIRVGGLALIVSLLDRVRSPLRTSASWTESGPVGVGSSKGVAISDDGSFKRIIEMRERACFDGPLGGGEARMRQRAPRGAAAR